MKVVSQPNKFVLFAIPTMSSHPAMECMGSCCRTVAQLYERRIAHAFRFRPGLCFIDMARNILCTEFLEEYPDATDLFFIDDDIGFPAEKVVEFLDRPQDVVAGIYPKRQDDPEFPVVLKQDDNRLPIEKDGLYLAANIPGGFVRIKRHVIEKLASVSEKYKFNDRERGDTSVYNIFELGPRDGYYWGEDSIFAKKLQDNGFEIWVDPKIQFDHRGQKKWTNTLMPSLEAYIGSVQKPDSLAA